MLVQRLAVLVVDHLGSGPIHLRPVRGTASLFSAVMSLHVLVGEARQAQKESAAAAQRILAHLFVAMTAVGAVAVRIDVAHETVGANSAAGVLLFPANRLSNRASLPIGGRWTGPSGAIQFATLRPCR